MTVLKYEEEIKKMSCDLTEFTERNARKSYRWVFEDINDGRNFLPVYQLDPKRKRNMCTGWSLSMYESKKQAKDKLQELIADKPNIYLRIGTHTAEGELSQQDGRSNDANPKNGHFDHFEYCDCDLANKFIVVECIVEVDNTDE